MPGSVLISVDYSLAPDSKFPIALQEALDVYLWLTSVNPEVEKVIGIKPQKILLVGDSAGGHIICSLLMILNDILKIQNDSNNPSTQQNAVQMPEAVFALFPLVTMSLYAYPSMIVLMAEPIVPMNLFWQMMKGFLNLDKQNSEKKTKKAGMNDIDQDPYIRA